MGNISKCSNDMVCSITECIQQVGVVRMKHSEIIKEVFQESINPIQLRFRQVRFEWAKARTLAKLKRKWAEAVWAKKPATASELVVAVVDCESI